MVISAVCGKLILNLTINSFSWPFLSRGLPKSIEIVVREISYLLYTGYKFTEASRKDVNSSIVTYHRIVEAFKFAYAYRALLGDEDFWNVTEVSRCLLLVLVLAPRGFSPGTPVFPSPH